LEYSSQLGFGEICIFRILRKVDVFLPVEMMAFASVLGPFGPPWMRGKGINEAAFSLVVDGVV
jgi:hypothetical protein